MGHGRTLWVGAQVVGFLEGSYPFVGLGVSGLYEETFEGLPLDLHCCGRKRSIEDIDNYMLLLFLVGRWEENTSAYFKSLYNLLQFMKVLDLGKLQKPFGVRRSGTQQVRMCYISLHAVSALFSTSDGLEYLNLAHFSTRLVEYVMAAAYYDNQ